MSDVSAEAVRRYLDDGLHPGVFEDDSRSTRDVATSFVRELFVELLGFEPVASRAHGAPWQSLPIVEWSPQTTARTARLVAEAGRFRVVYVELDSVTRERERRAIRELTRSEEAGDWGPAGTVLVVFHAPGEGVWHLVTPFQQSSDDVTTGRLVLRRFTLGAGVTHRSVADALASLNVAAPNLAERVHDAFSPESVTEAFYRDYRRAFESLRRESRDSGLDAAAARRCAHVTLTRLLSLYLLQSGGLLGGRPDFVRWFHDRYRASGANEAFHETWLDALLFEGLARPAGAPVDADVPDDVAAALSALPAVNAGLFDRTESDGFDVTLSDSALDSVVRDFLERYTYTTSEESVYDVDVAVDPAMLGKMYESFVAAEDRDDAGIFYTPHTEVDLLCRLALSEQCRLASAPLDAAGERALVDFVFSDPLQWDGSNELDTETLLATLRDVRVVDPACGSGAFLVGTMQVLSELLGKLGLTVDAVQRRRIVERALSGVDIKPWAVDVAAFRLWLALVERDHAEDPTASLPTLSLDLHSGDSLVEDVASPDGGGPASSSVGSAANGGGFRWRRDFADVFDAGGFDVVLTNPPYVGHQHIAGTQAAHEVTGRRSPESPDAPETAYKDALVSFVRSRFGIEPFRRSDLYLYFFFRALDVLRDGGTLAFITSNAWLDTAYGKRLQQGLLELTDLDLVVENRETRTFASADVNTALTVATKTPTRELAGDVGFVALGDSYDRVLSDRLFQRVLTDRFAGIEADADVDADGFAVGTERGLFSRVGDHRVVRLDEAALWRLGGGTVSASTTPGGTYSGYPWGQFLRAPSTYFELLDAGADAFVPLSAVATVGSYLNTGGADDFFFVDVVAGDPEADPTVTIRNRATGETFTVESEFVVPVVASPRQVTRIDLSLADYDTHVLCIPAETDLSETRVSAYVDWGEEEPRSYHTTSGRRKVARWWALGRRAQTNARVVWPNRQNARHFVAYNPERTVTHRFYRLEPRDDVETTPEELAALLNFSPTSLFTEVLTSAGLGQGVLDVTGTTLRCVPVVDPDVLSSESKARVRAAFRDMCRRDIGTLHEELGAQTPADVHLEGVAADRRRLDGELFETALGFDHRAREAVYAAILRTVNDRIDKSRSV